MTFGRAVVVAVSLAGAVGCKGGKVGSEADGKAAVMRYLQKLVEAYRASDEEIVDPLVLPEHGERLTGLIGVKRDQGVVLDAELLEIAFQGFGEKDGRMIVETHERWRYRNRAIGTGKIAGPESTDEYRVRYQLVREKGALKIAEISFIGEPTVGTPIDPGRMSVRAAHGLAGSGETSPEAPSAAPPASSGARDGAPGTPRPR